MASSIISAKTCDIFTGLLSRRVVLLGARRRGRHEKCSNLKGRAVQRQEGLAEGTMESSWLCTSDPRLKMSTSGSGSRLLPVFDHKYI